MTTRVRRATRLGSFLLFCAALAGCDTGGGSQSTGSAAATASASPKPPPAALAGCYTGKGTAPDGGPLIASLRLTATGGNVTGTYVVGATVDTGLEYKVAGTLTRGRFTGSFTAAGVAVRAAGAADARRVLLDPGRGFSITRFDVGGEACQ